jgi:hypothetical protein
MKTAATIFFLLVFCIGCASLSYMHGPGPDSTEFHSGLNAAVGPDREAVSILAAWYPNTHGYDNILEVSDKETLGVLALTQEDVIFFNWRLDLYEYVPEKTISREDLIDVVVKAKGRSRLLVLVTEDDVNTFVLARDGGWFVDTESTDAIAAALADSLTR